MGMWAIQGGLSKPEQKEEVLEASLTPHDERSARGTLLPSSVTS